MSSVNITLQTDSRAIFNEFCSFPGYRKLDATSQEIRLIRILPRNDRTHPTSSFRSTLRKGFRYLHSRYMYWSSKTPSPSPSMSPNKGIIHCTLQYASLKSSLVYHALSYTWGSTNRRRPIILNERIFWVTENLHAALEQLRERRDETPIWIDAICINQADEIEKSNQV